MFLFYGKVSMTTAQTYVSLLSGRGDARAGGLETAGLPAGLSQDKPQLLERLQAEIAYTERLTGVHPNPADVDLLLAQADEGLSRLLGDGPDAVLTDETISGLEAVVRTDGSRPVLFVEDDFVDVMAPSIGDYAVALSRHEDSVRQVCQSVGRVDDPSGAAGALGYQGTAWIIGDGLAITNYHVLRAVAAGGVRTGNHFEGQLNTGVAVHFGHEVGALGPARRFPVRRVVSVGREGAAGYVDPVSGLNFDELDMAVLELEPVAGRAFPEPVRVARQDDPLTRGGLASAGRSVYVVGYPGNEQSTTPDLFAQLFAGVKSYKRLAPGAIIAAPGEVPDDQRGWILTHDASTLGGNSGSVVVDLDADGRTALGLHFAGLHGQRNWGHALERMGTELADVLSGQRR